jgi:hypothetical protein
MRFTTRTPTRDERRHPNLLITGNQEIQGRRDRLALPDKVSDARTQCVYRNARELWSHQEIFLAVNLYHGCQCLHQA